MAKIYAPSFCFSLTYYSVMSSSPYLKYSWEKDSSIKLALEAPLNMKRLDKKGMMIIVFSVASTLPYQFHYLYSMS